MLDDIENLNLNAACISLILLKMFTMTPGPKVTLSRAYAKRISPCPLSHHSKNSWVLITLVWGQHIEPSDTSLTDSARFCSWNSKTEDNKDNIRKFWLAGYIGGLLLKCCTCQCQIKKKLEITKGWRATVKFHQVELIVMHE